MVPAHPSVLLKMATPRRYLDKAHAHRDRRRRLRRRLSPRPGTRRRARFATFAFRVAAAITCNSRPPAAGRSLPWLFLLRQPTLIMAGADDPLVPTINARVMQWLIPDARLEILDCGHLFLVTRAAESARIVESFLTEPAATRASAPPRAPLPDPPHPGEFHEGPRHRAHAVGLRPPALDRADPRVRRRQGAGAGDRLRRPPPLYLRDARRTRAPSRLRARRPGRRRPARRSR